MLSHGLTSAALFFLIGSLSERYHTRSIIAYGGLLNPMPVFSFFLIVISLANIGFPGTSGFLPEFFIITAVIGTNPLLLFPVLFGMVLTTSSALVLLLRLLFGHVKLLYGQSSYSDITYLEFFILGYLSMWVVILGFLDVLPETIQFISD